MDLFKSSLVTLGCVLVGACSTVKNDSNSTSARASLASAGVPYTSAAFIAEAGKGNESAVKEFLDAGMNINVNPNITALQAAVATHQNNMVKYLIANGAKVNEDTYMGSPLTVAAFSRNTEGAEILINNGAKVDFKSGDGFTPLGASVYMNDAKMVDLLAKHGADVNFVYNTMGRNYLGVAAMLGNFDAVKALVANGADVNYVGYGKLTALDWSAFGAHYDLTKFLIEHGANLTVGENNAVPVVMIAALAHKNDNMIKYLISKGVDVNGTAFGKMPLLNWCAKNNLTNSAIELIKLGANINQKGPTGSTAFDIALTTGNKDLVHAIDPKFDLSKVPPVPTDPNIVGQAAAITSLSTSDFKSSQDNVVQNIQVLINNSGLPTNVNEGSPANVQPAVTPVPSPTDIVKPKIGSAVNSMDINTNSGSNEPSFNDFNKQINEDMKNIDQTLNNSSDDTTSSSTPTQKNSINQSMQDIDLGLNNSTKNPTTSVPDASQK